MSRMGLGVVVLAGAMLGQFGGVGGIGGGQIVPRFGPERFKGECVLVRLDAVAPLGGGGITVIPGDWLIVSTTRGNIESIALRGAELERIADLDEGTLVTNGVRTRAAPAGGSLVLLRATKPGEAGLAIKIRHDDKWTESREITVTVEAAKDDAADGEPVKQPKKGTRP